MKKLGTCFAVFGFLAVLLGAFGAHGLKSHLDEAALKIYHTGVEYHFYHTLALGLSILLYRSVPNDCFKRAGTAFVIGILLFSGSLYILAITGNPAFGIITPFGGVSFLLGWIFMGRALRQN